MLPLFVGNSMDRESRKAVGVEVDDSDPRDLTARCDQCGKQGTIARATRHSAPPLVLRYCGTCWPAAGDELERRERDEHERWRNAHLARGPANAEVSEEAPAPWSTSSRSWHDVRRFLKMLSDAAKSGVVPKEAQLAATVQEIISTANEMDGPMPADVKEFLMKNSPVAA
jgi:hypothetical protein